MNQHGMNRKNAHTRQNMKRNKKRPMLIQGTLVLTLSFVLWRVYDVQTVYGKRLESSEKNYVGVHKTLLAERGSILDSAGDQLAYDIPAYMVDIKTDANLKKYASEIATEIAPILGTSVSHLTIVLNGSNTWIQWPYSVQTPAYTKLMKIFKTHDWDTNKNSSIQWNAYITFTSTEKRFYPFSQFAANVLGFVATNGKPQGGVEQEYNKYLSGTNGEMTYEQDAQGFPIPNSEHTVKASQSGDNIYLTLNNIIQGEVEDEMNKLVNQYHPAHAAIIVTNPQTGAILALSSSPSFNPNTYWTASANALSQNWALSSFEPGSTFKPFIYAAALNSGSVSPNQTYHSGQYVVDGQTINDWNYGFGWGTLTYQEALEKSSNTGFARIALATGWPVINRYLQLFGFTQPTGIDLPGENSSILFPKSEQNPIELATTGFGQGISVTPIQQMMAMGVIANGGKLMKPYVVSKITSPSGKLIKRVNPKIVRQGFVSQSVLNEVKNTMVLDVSGKQGIDTAARIPGYDVAGKTGTAQIADPKTGKYYSNRFIVSFMGFAPAADPKVEVYVTVDYPKTPTANTWGSTIAAPFAKDIMKDCFKYYHIIPNGTLKSTTNATSLTSAGSVSYVDTPQIIGLTEQTAQQKLKSIGLSAMLVGQGSIVKDQWPQAGIQVVKGSKMFGVLNTKTGNKVKLPNLTGLSLRDATNLLAALKLNIQLSGSGYVVHQSIPANTLVKSGALIHVTLNP